MKRVALVLFFVVIIAASAKGPETQQGAIQYEYYPNGNLKRRIDPRIVPLTSGTVSFNVSISGTQIRIQLP